MSTSPLKAESLAAPAEGNLGTRCSHEPIPLFFWPPSWAMAGTRQMFSHGNSPHIGGFSPKWNTHPPKMAEGSS